MYINNIILVFRFVLFISVFASSICVSAQEDPIVKDRTEKVIWKDNQTFEQVIEIARNLAKDNALIDAGIIQHHQSYFSTTISEENGNTDNSIYYRSSTELSGRILSVKDNKPPKVKNKRGERYVYIDVKITIIKYLTVKDPTFVSDFYGIEEAYQDSSCIRFKISPNKDCYLVFFWLTDDETQILYPIPEKEIRDDRLHNRLFTKNKKVPINWIYTALNGKPYEKGSLICVMTKEYIPFPFHKRKKVNGFSTQTTREDFFEWIFPIERDQKNVYEFYITIVPK